MAGQQHQEEFLLKWNDHHASFFNIVEDLCRTEQLCDVTLACGGQVFETHRLILSVCSPYFRAMLNRGDKHPIVYLKDVNPQHLEQLLSYMYRGEINVLQDDLGPLIETARGLQIKGLADAGGSDKKKDQVHQQQQQQHVQPQQKSLLKRPRTTTPTPPAPKQPKVDKPKKSLVPILNPEAAIPGLNPILPVVTSVSSAVPTTTNTDEGEGIVKLENEEAWTEDSIPRDSYEAGLNKNYEQDLAKSYEADLQMEDEKYIQPEGGLTGQQVLPSSTAAAGGVRLPANLSLTPCSVATSSPSQVVVAARNMSPPASPAVSPPALSLQSWCSIKQPDTQIFTCTYCNRNFNQAKELHSHVKTLHNSHTQIENSLSSLERLSCMGVSVALAAAPSGLAGSVGQLPASRPITGKRLSGSPGLQPPFHSASAMGNKKFYEQHSSMKTFQSSLGPKPLQYSHSPASEPNSLSTNLPTPQSFHRQRANQVENRGSMDPIKDTLKQLSRLAGGSGAGQPAATSQSSIIKPADSNQPILHRDTEERDGNARKSPSVAHKENRGIETGSAQHTIDDLNGRSIKSEIPDDFRSPDA